jgi:adenylate cyclase
MGVERQIRARALPEDDPVPVPAIIAQVERMVGSAAFEVSDRHKRFLSYVVRETLDGRADRIKAYTIATAAFDRGADFDPQIDPIVRIEAGRLRRGLELYYLRAGAADSVRIEIPKGSYVPVFKMNTPVSPAGSAVVEQDTLIEPAGAGARPAPRKFALLGIAALCATILGVALWFTVFRADSGGKAISTGPTILVAPFTYDGQPPRRDVADGLTREIIGGLTRFNGVIVFGPDTTFQQAGAEDVRKSAQDLDADYLVVGSTNAIETTFKVSVSLINVGSGEYVWSKAFTGRLLPQDLFAAEEQIAAQIVQALAQPYGIIFDDQVKALRTRPPNSLSSYDCVLSFYQYTRKADLPQFQAVRACLEHVAETDPNYAIALSSLSLLYCDVARYRFDADRVDFDPLKRALQLAERAVELEPQATHGYEALHLVYWLLNNVEESLRAAETGLALNPNNTDLMAGLGGRLYLTGQWDRGYALLQEARARNPGLSDLYRTVTFFQFYREGRYEEALAEARRLNLPNIINGSLMIAAAAGQLGKTVEGEEAVRRILAFDPAFGKEAVTRFKKRNLHPDLIRGMVDGLRKAGLEIPEQEIRKISDGNG